MMERGSVALLASQVVHLIPSLTQTSLSSDSERSAGGVGGGGAGGVGIRESGVGRCRVFWVMGLQIHGDGEFN